MSILRQIRLRFSFLGRYHFRWILLIALSWTVVDLIWIRYFHFNINLRGEDPSQFLSRRAIILRAIIVFFMSSFMGYMLLFKLRQVFRDVPLLVSLLLKTGILLIAAIFMNFLLHSTYSVFILNLGFKRGILIFFEDATSTIWLVHHSLGWVALFLITQLVIEFYEKYSPGVFWDILIGRYIRPKVQKRIVMFLDLIDSTPIAEQLDSQKYFSFIRDFIYYVSMAILENHGRIYQYVGDEIVVSWPYSARNRENCIKALIMSRKLIRRNSSYFYRRYGFVPEFKAGIHAGEVTVGEIGIVKKDIVMSGDIMNTAARIRTACNELNRQYIASGEFIDGFRMEWPIESLGPVDLKGKSESTELYALKI